MFHNALAAHHLHTADVMTSSLTVASHFFPRPPKMLVHGPLLFCWHSLS